MQLKFVYCHYKGPDSLGLIKKIDWRAAILSPNISQCGNVDFWSFFLFFKDGFFDHLNFYSVFLHTYQNVANFAHKKEK